MFSKMYIVKLYNVYCKLYNDPSSVSIIFDELG